MSYEFQSTLFRTQFQMHVAMAESWLCAGGINDREVMQQFLAEMTDDQLATDAEEGWGLAEREDYDRAELIDAFHEIRKDFDAHFPADL